MKKIRLATKLGKMLLPSRKYHEFQTHFFSRFVCRYSKNETFGSFYFCSFCESPKTVKFFWGLIYIIKQEIRIYVPYSRPNGWTEWAEFFVDIHGWPGGVIG